MERAGAAGTGADAERKGLGTPATRADIIEKLVHDGFVEHKKKQLVPTEDGIKRIGVLPDAVKSPQLTAACKRLKWQKGSYDAYLIPEGVTEYSYMKDGKEIQGFQYRLKLEFPQEKQMSRKNQG